MDSLLGLGDTVNDLFGVHFSAGKVRREWVLGIVPDSLGEVSIKTIAVRVLRITINLQVFYSLGLKI